MNFTWLRNLTQQRSYRAPKSSSPLERRRARLCLETLEDRTVPSSVQLFGTSTLVVEADANAPVTFVVGADPNKFDVNVGGTDFGQFGVSVVLTELNGSNTVTVNAANGYPFKAGTIVDLLANAGGDTNNTLILSGGTLTTPDTLTPATATTVGTLVTANATIKFDNSITQVQDLSPTTSSFTVDAPGTTVSVGTAFSLPGDGLVAAGATGFFTPTVFNNKAVLNLATESGDATVTVNNTVASTDLLSYNIQLLGGDTTLNVDATPAHVNTEVQTEGNFDSVNVGANGSSGSLASIGGNFFVVGTSAVQAAVSLDDFSRTVPTGTNYFLNNSGTNTSDLAVPGVAGSYAFTGTVNLKVFGGHGNYTMAIDGTSANAQAAVSMFTGFSSTDADSVYVEATSCPVTIGSSNTASVVVVGSNPSTVTSSTLSTIHSSLTVDGSADLIVFDEAGSGNNDTITTITESSLKVVQDNGPTLATITYNGPNQILFFGGNGLNAFVVQPSTPTASFGGNGITEVLLVTNGFPDAFANVAVTVDPASKLNLFVNSSGSSNQGPFGVLNVLDPTRTAAIRGNIITPNGTIAVDYPGGTNSSVGYSGMSSVSVLPDADHSFVQALYHNDLGYSATPEELDYWVFTMTDLTQFGVPNLTPQQVVNEIAHSTAAYDYLINNLYEQYLNRPVDSAGEAFFLKVLQNGGTEEQVAADILGSAEYFKDNSTGAKSTANANFVASLYTKLLNQTATSAEIAAGVNQIATLPATLLASTAYRDAQVLLDCTTILQQTAAEASGAVAFWVNQTPGDLLSIRNDMEDTSLFFNAGV